MKLCEVKTMRYFCVLACTIVISGQSLLAAEEMENQLTGKTVYVKPSSEVVVRRGKGTEYKIIALVKDGSSLEVLEEDESYARVRLPNDKEGWILSRFLSEEPPLDQLVLDLRKKNEAAAVRTAETEDELEELQAILNQTKAELSNALEQRDSAVEDYAELQQATADVVKIKTELQETKTENEELSQELAAIQLENDNLSKDKKLYWFLGGAGVLLLGMLLGRMPGPSRRRKSSLI